MTTLAHFHPATEVTADDRSRIPLGRLGVDPATRYAVATADDGSILLTPMVSIPVRELIVFENEQVRASLARGLADVAAGRTRRMDWVTAADADGAATE